MDDKALCPRQRLFIREYLLDKNATRAAIAAGYSKKTARFIGAENLTKPNIRSAINMGLAMQEADLNKKAVLLGVTKERMIQELAKVAFANMDDFAVIDERGGVKLIATKDRRPGAGGAIKKIAESTSQYGGSVGLELQSKDRAQELLCKLLGWTKTELDLNLPTINVQVILTMPRNGSERIARD